MFFPLGARKNFAAACFSLGALVLLSASGRGDAVVTDPVGYVNTSIQGTNGTGSSVLTFLGLSVTQPVAFQGTIGTYDATSHTLTPANGTFTADEFDGTNGAYFVEITSGAAAGLFSDITATTASPSSITTADDLSAQVTSGETFKIRAHWTLQSVFGPNVNTNNQVILGTGGASTADNVLVYDRASEQYVTYYYKVGGVYGGNGWRSTTGSDPLATDVSNTVLRVTDSAIIERKLSAAVTLSLPGVVKLGSTQREVLSGLNFCGDLYASGTTLGNSGLYNPNDPNNSLVGGGSSTADQVLVYDGTEYVTYYYKIGGVYGGNGWRSTSGTDPLATDVSSTPLPAGYGIIVKRLGSQAFDWTATQPFTISN
jgi:uncharacterized protein (TIGR02597 family)